MKVFVIQHLYFEGLGSIQPELLKWGHEVSLFHAASVTDMEVLSTYRADMLIVLGGPVAVYDADQYPFLTQEKKIIESYMEERKPVIGICLGAQLIADVLGARVYGGQTKEIGWAPISVPENCSVEYLRLFNGQNVFHWHGDTFELPAGSERLASSAVYENQAFLYGDNVIGLQFHLEFLARELEYWLIGHCCEIAGAPSVSIEALRRDTASYGRQLEELSGRFWQQWLCTSGQHA